MSNMRFWIFDFEVMYRTYSQVLSIRVSHDPYCYLSIKKLFWFNFFTDFTDRKLVLIHKNGKP